MTVLATETWTGTNGAAWPSSPNTWVSPTGGSAAGSATISSNAGKLTSPATAYGYAVRNLSSMSSSTGDCDVTLTVSAVTSGVEQYCGVAIDAAPTTIASNGTSANAIQLLLEYNATSGSSVLAVFQGSTQVGSNVTKTLAGGTTYSVHINRTGGVYSARVYTGTEPSTWDFQLPMSSMPVSTTPTGVVSLMGQAGSATTARSFLFDTLTVTDGVVSSTFTGSGSLAATPQPNPVQGTTFSGSGSLAAAPAPVVVQSTAFSGSGSLAATPVDSSMSQAAALSGAGTLVAVSVPQPAQSAALSGGGVLSAVAGAAQVALSGAGSLSTVQGAVPVAISGSGLLTAVGSAGPISSDTFTGSGSLSTSQALAVAGDSRAFSGSGALTASGVPKPSQSAAFSGSGLLSANGATPRPVSTSSFSGSGALTAVGSAQASFSGTGTLAATPAGGYSSFSGSGSLLPSSTITIGASVVSFTGIGALTTNKQNQSPDDYIRQNSGLPATASRDDHLHAYFAAQAGVSSGSTADLELATYRRVLGTSTGSIDDLKPQWLQAMGLSTAGLW